MRIGIDVHGVADLYPEFFSRLSHKLIETGHEIHIITGQEWEKVEPTVRKHNIAYSKYFSIVDYHLSIGTKTWRDEKNTVWMDEQVWLRSKGDYIHRESIDIHFDDSHEYANWIPNTCTFMMVPEKNFEKFISFLTLIER